MYSKHKKAGKHFRYGCFGTPWPMRSMKMAYAYGYSVPDGSFDSGDDQRTDTGAGERSRDTWYAHREHRGRRGHRSGNFGVRRPLRYLSYQLDLDESQRRQVAAALDSVKIEREQMALDEKKMVSALADLVHKGGTDEADSKLSTDVLKDALSPRVRSNEQLQKRIAKALKQIVEVLDPDQRQEFAYLIRTGDFRV
jgi:Spy/CpxP family protein refolding chaperone